MQSSDSTIYFETRHEEHTFYSSLESSLQGWKDTEFLFLVGQNAVCLLNKHQIHSQH